MDLLRAVGAPGRIGDGPRLGSMGCFVDERLPGGPRGETGGAIAVVDELHVGHRVVGVGGQRGTIAQVGGERLKLVGVGRSAAEFFGAGSGRSSHDDPVVVVRLDEIQGGRLATAADDPAVVSPVVGGHAAAGPPGGAAGEFQVGVEPFVDSGAPGTFTGAGG